MIETRFRNLELRISDLVTYIGTRNFLIQAGFKFYAVTSWIERRHDNGVNHSDLITFFSPPSELATNLPEDLRLWSMLGTAPFPTQQILWFSTDSTEILGAAEEIVVKTFSTTGRFQISINVRGSQSVMVALIRELATISPHYLSKLVLSSRIYGFTALEHDARMLENVRTGTRRVCYTLGAQRITRLEHSGDVRTGRPARTTAIQFRINADPEPVGACAVQRQNLFRILLEGVWQCPDAASQRIWEGMWERTNLPLGFDPESATTAGVCSALHHAWDYSRWMLKGLSTLESATIGSYKHDMRLIPRDHAINVLNLVYSIVDSRPPNDSGIWLDRVFLGRAQHLVQLLSNYSTIV
ncbi:hypothetical protein C8J57DRAFT_1252807 [Mycena rebaudengoi]|nr:hypothetical protein C8J57DRAFT_1252807 [Mycena rebaudengoi]